MYHALQVKISIPNVCLVGNPCFVLISFQNILFLVVPRENACEQSIRNSKDMISIDSHAEIYSCNCDNAQACAYWCCAKWTNLKYRWLVELFMIGERVIGDYRDDLGTTFVLPLLNNLKYGESAGKVHTHYHLFGILECKTCIFFRNANV